MCNCLNKSEQKLAAHLIVDKGLTNVKQSHYANTAFTFDKKVEGGRVLYLPFEIEYVPIKKDGTPGKQKTFKVNVTPSFCPFCGKSLKDEETPKKPENEKVTTDNTVPVI